MVTALTKHFLQIGWFTMAEIDLYHPPSRRSFKIPQTIEGTSGKTYVLEYESGFGGNAVVYKGYNEFSGDEVALKFLIDNRAVRKKRFTFEIETLKNHAHPHIVRYLDSGTVPGTWRKGNKGRKNRRTLPFLVMEYSDQGNLKTWLNDNRPVSPEVYAAQFRGLANGLADMHNGNILHRDIKPENILVVEGRWVLSDFGLSTSADRANQIDLTPEGEKVGPLFWMSPEALNRCLGVKSVRAKISKSSDVFQLASVFWFVVNNNHPSGVLKEADWKGRRDIFDICWRALQHDPKERYRDAAEFHQAFG